MKVSWINVYCQSIWWPSIVAKIHLTLTFLGKTVSVCLKLKCNPKHCHVCTKRRKTVQNTLVLSVYTTWNIIWEIQWITRASYMQWLTHWFSGFILELSWLLSYSMKMHIKTQFYNPLFCKGPLSLKSWLEN